MFDDMDAKKAELGVEAYGISVTTLEEVFLMVAKEQVGGAWCILNCVAYCC